MSVHIEAQQVAAEYLGALGVHATLMVHFPSKIKAPEGIARAEVAARQEACV